MSVRVLILRTAGTNCDKESVRAFEDVGAEVELKHVNELIQNQSYLEQFQILFIPGGFSYGDYISAGIVFANQLRFALREAITRFYDDGKLIIGVCNGFQILVKAGLLPGNTLFSQERDVTLTFNQSCQFEDRWVRLHSPPSACSFISGMEQWSAPIAHAEGRFIVKNDEILTSLKQKGQILLQYVDKLGNSTMNYPDNPNGSFHSIAGICDPEGRIIGLMPHPERNIYQYHHPLWTSSKEREEKSPSGRLFFQRAVQYLENNSIVKN